MNASKAGAWAAVLVAGLLGNTTRAVTMEMVPVGDPGNSPDTRYNGIAVGSVAATYKIGKYEVTNSQYAEFLNAVDPNGKNPHSLYSTNMGSGYGGISFASEANPGWKYTTRSGRGNLPVNYVSFWDACRFANWMHNGQGTDGTETGAYSLNDATSPPNTIARNPDAKFCIPSEDEWYKAAYYKAGGIDAGYWDYPTQSDTAPRAERPAGNDLINGSANYGYAVADLTNAGSYTAHPSDSAYGTFDEGGNVWEWNETVPYGSNRGLRGGSLYNYDQSLHASYRNIGNPTQESSSIGFRVAAFPEPASLVLLLFGGMGMLVRRRGPGR
jgi:sulfatase modifying factor 1